MHACVRVHTHTQKNFDLYLTPYTEINPKWIISLNIKPKIIKLLKENTGKNPCDLELGKDFWI